MSRINYWRDYQLGDDHEEIKVRARKHLPKYIDDPGLFNFDDQARTLTYKTEKLIPEVSTGRPRVMLLFSNPHPHSVRQGMFLSPNTIGIENQFWRMMRESGWLDFKDQPGDLREKARRCLAADYHGPFDLVFYCYYAFPTDYPKDIPKIFGKDYFKKTIAPEARCEFLKTVGEGAVAAVLTFNKGVFNLVSENKVKTYIQRLKAGEVIQGLVQDTQQDLPIFLTYPTGWRFHTDFKRLRVESLEAIKKLI